jgi:predicted component of type VI protein secretion system
METKLLITSGTSSQRWVALRLPTVLGRGREASLMVPHALISRRHCELFEQDGLLMLRDLGSLNGTMVAGRRVALAPLPPGAEFTVGPLTFQAHYEYEGDPAAIPPAQFLDEPQPSAKPSIEGEAASAAEDELPEFLAVEGLAASPAPDIADSQPEIPVFPARKKEAWSSPVGGPPEEDLPDEDAPSDGFLDDLE